MKRIEDRRNFFLSLAPPLAVAVVAIALLGWLGLENLNGVGDLRQTVHDHTVVIQNLFFRD
jgi:hypothetical protein